MARSTRTDSRILYHNGPVWTGTPVVYFIWYGNWNQGNGSDTPAGKQLVFDFIARVALARAADLGVELLGAILVNNEAFYRVSDFLNPEHFFEPIHQKIYQLARDLIRAGKVATPVTLKTFIGADTDIGGMTVGQYLARLAAEATTVINAEDYGRTIYDLATRRDLIQIGDLEC
mgnify:CR=1 FL=1